MVIIVCSTCGGTAVGVSKRGHTVVIVHGTCGGWRLATGGRGAYRRHRHVRYLWWVGISKRGGGTVVVVVCGTCGGTYLVRRRPPRHHPARRHHHCGGASVENSKKREGDSPRPSSLSLRVWCCCRWCISVNAPPPQKKKGGYIPCPSSPSLLVVMLFQVVSQGQCKKNPKKKGGGNVPCPSSPSPSS